jgi:hypothetical protein
MMVRESSLQSRIRGQAEAGLAGPGLFSLFSLFRLASPGCDGGASDDHSVQLVSCSGVAACEQQGADLMHCPLPPKSLPLAAAWCVLRPKCTAGCDLRSGTASKYQVGTTVICRCTRHGWKVC